VWQRIALWLLQSVFFPVRDCSSSSVHPVPLKHGLLESDTALAFFDGYPIAEGHALVIPKRHVANLFDLPEAELRAIWSLVAKMHGSLKERFRRDGFNVGMNEGEAAGQTIGHAHVHIIPRRKGDVPDALGELGAPRVGERGIKKPHLGRVGGTKTVVRLEMTASITGRGSRTTAEDCPTGLSEQYSAR
jgi:diadenosine tetraphosphate (Ap4A) HIT family hydrolase